ncbi:hypothetical protein PPACK8108_LOCUS18278 [Phakopsora pachyrhizi]|uniref:Uncharacterized protein n=1 Tax=Phakopsora pachyrhizi TaxID=170000 RepID=A0AAV0BFP7_PHAPC|nr:hypothetical protein PPACK8108_LOCUS18278 [Phakopsora pachyrhizi]
MPSDLIEIKKSRKVPFFNVYSRHSGIVFSSHQTVRHRHSSLPEQSRIQLLKTIAHRGFINA